MPRKKIRREQGPIQPGKRSELKNEFIAIQNTLLELDRTILANQQTLENLK